MHVDALTRFGDAILRDASGERVIAVDGRHCVFSMTVFTRDQLRELLPHLEAWVETGSLPVEREEGGA